MTGIWCFTACILNARKQKEMMKALETPEEKRLRRLAKKEAKERKKREREGWDKDYLVSSPIFSPTEEQSLLFIQYFMICIC